MVDVVIEMFLKFVMLEFGSDTLKD